MTAEVVEGLYRALVRELKRRDHPAGRPVKVADIYRDLVPYQAVREALELDLNADYEHALLRLLAGEGDRLHLDSAQGREKLRREVELPYPAVGLFREFADTDVRVRMPPDAPGALPGGDRDEPAEPAASPAPTGTADREPDGRAEDRPPVRLHTDGVSGPQCPFCGEALPGERTVRYCPACGGDQQLRRCSHCEAMLEREWRFCIRCGREVTDR